MFQGFSPEAIDFLWGIRLNNNRDWFMSHKEQYQKTLYEPLKELGQELFAPFADVPGLRLKVSRIYRDTRLHPSEPYKSDLWIAIRRDSDFWSEHPTLYLDISTEGVSYGLNLWRPKPAAMAAFRRDLEQNPKAFETLLRQTEAAVGAPVTAQRYKREKPCAVPGMGPWFNWKGDISCSVTEPVGDGIFSPQLKDRSLQALQALLPMLEYFQKFTG